MKKKAIILLPIILILLLIGFNRGKDTFYFAEQKDGIFVFGEENQNYQYELEYGEEEKSKLTKEKNTYMGEVDFEMSNILNDDIDLIVRKVNINSNDDDIVINAYDFKTNEKLEGTITISIPYTSKIAGAGYFNEETKTWEPVMFSVDEKNKKVVIYTDHLSTYASFSIENENSRNAYIKAGMFESDDFLLKYRDAYGDVVKEAISNQMTPGEKAYDLGKGIVDDWMNVSGAMLTFEGLAYSSSYLSELSDMMGNVGSAMVLAQIATDYNRGDEQTLAVNTWKSSINYAVSTWGSKALQVSFIGVTAIDYSINKLAEELISGRQDLWTKAYLAYYKENNVRTGRDWYARTKQIMSNSNNAEQFDRMINNELDNYTYLFWLENDDVLAFYQSEVMEQGFTGGGGLNESLKKEIADLYKTKLLRDYLSPIFRQVERDLQLEMYKDYQNNLNELRSLLNQRIRFEIIDETKEFAGYIVKLAELNEKSNETEWRGTLDEDGNLKASFTVLGHLSAGAPTKIELYKSVKDYKAGNIVHEVEFVIDVPETKVYLNGKKDKVSNSFNMTNTVEICPGGYGQYCSRNNQEIINSLTLNATGEFVGEVKNIETVISDGSKYNEGSLIVTVTVQSGDMIHLKSNLGVSTANSSGTYEDISSMKRECKFELGYEGLEKNIGGGAEVKSETNSSISFEAGFFRGDLGSEGGLLASVGSSAQTNSICSKNGFDSNSKLFALHNGPKIYIIAKYE